MKNNEGKDPFEALFRERFNDFESNPSETAWQNISAAIKPEKQFRVPFWFWSAAILAGLILALLGWQNAKEDNNVIAIQQKQSQIKEESKQVFSNKEIPKNIATKKAVVLQSVDNQNIETNILKLTDAKNSNINSLTISKLPILNDKIASKATDKSSKNSLLNLVENEVVKSVENNGVLNPPTKNDLSFVENSVAKAENISPSISEQLSISENQLLASVSVQVAMLKCKPFSSKTDMQMPAIVFENAVTPKVVIDKAGEFKRKPMIYISATPMYNYYNVRPLTNDNQLIQSVKLNNKDRLGLNFQLGARWLITQKLSVKTYFNYTRLNENLNYQAQSVDPISYNTQIVDNNSINVTPVYQVKNLSSATTWHMLGGGLEVQYQVFQIKNTKHFVGLSRDLNLILPADGTKGLNGFVNLSYGITQKIGEGLVLSVEPTLNYSLRSQSDQHGLLNLQPYSMGLKFGLGFALK